MDVQKKYEALAGWARERLGISEISHRWSAQDVSTADGIPFVGRYHRGARHLWVGTGFGQWGMTGGTAAGLLLAELIMGLTPDDERELFDPHRFDLRSPPALARRNGVVAAHLVGDMSRTVLTKATQDLGPGKAQVCRVGTSMFATFRDDDGLVHVVFAHCTHLGCLLAINNAERPTVARSASLRQAVSSVANLPTAPSGKVYELWLQQGTAMVKTGSYQAARRTPSCSVIDVRVSVCGHGGGGRLRQALRKLPRRRPLLRGPRRPR